MNVLELSGVTKRFGGRTVLSELTFSVPEGCIFGFIGENGAGKTTTMKIITGLLASDDGEVRVCGEKAAYGQTRTNRFVGYLPDVPEFYGYLTPREYLSLVGGLAGVDAHTLRHRAEELLSLVGLSADANRRIGGFSRGMKQCPLPQLCVSSKMTAAFILLRLKLSTPISRASVSASAKLPPICPDESMYGLSRSSSSALSP